MQESQRRIAVYKYNRLDFIDGGEIRSSVANEAGVVIECYQSLCRCIRWSERESQGSIEVTSGLVVRPNERFYSVVTHNINLCFPVQIIVLALIYSGTLSHWVILCRSSEAWQETRIKNNQAIVTTKVSLFLFVVLISMCSGNIFTNIRAVSSIVTIHMRLYYVYYRSLDVRALLNSAFAYCRSVSVTSKTFLWATLFD